jgi:hypothetical protein
LAFFFDDFIFCFFIKFKKTTPQISGTLRGYRDRIGFDGSHLVLDASRFGLQNVYDVSVFINNLCGKGNDNDYTKPAFLPLLRRIKRAAGIIVRGV